ncbi:MAG TPA: aspartyl protease family protein [Vicinamibacterales bacterium]
MTRSGRSAAVLAVLALAGMGLRVSAFGRPQASLASLADRVELPSLGTVVPMDDLSGRPVVGVWINGRGPFPFIVGTGAPVTAITQDLVNDLGLTPDSDELASGPFLADELRVGEAVAHAVPLGRTVVVSGQGDTPVRGVLSPASFPGVLFALDYLGGRLRLLSGALQPPDGHRVFEYPPEETVPTVSVDVAGHAFDVQVDSNAPGGLTLPTRDAADLPLADQPIEIGRVVEVFGDFPVSVATLNGIVGIGDFPLEIHSIIFSDLRPVLGAGRGSIGARILETFVLTLDVKNHRLRFDRPGGGD